MKSGAILVIFVKIRLAFCKMFQSDNLKRPIYYYMSMIIHVIKIPGGELLNITVQRETVENLVESGENLAICVDF